MKSCSPLCSAIPCNSECIINSGLYLSGGVAVIAALIAIFALGVILGDALGTQLFDVDTAMWWDIAEYAGITAGSSAAFLALMVGGMSAYSAYQERHFYQHVNKTQIRWE